MNRDELSQDEMELGIQALWWLPAWRC